MSMVSEHDESDEFVWQAARGDVRLPAGTYAIEADPHTGETRIFDAQGRTVVTSWDEPSDDPALGPDAARWTPEDNG